MHAGIGFDSESEQEPALLVEVTRGPITESRHRGDVIALDGNGEPVASLGAPNKVTFLRSSSKPLQALPLVASGAADRFGFTEQEVALACASHNGEPIHTQIVESMLTKIGLGTDALRCGVHEPYSADEARRLRERGEAPNVLQNNCSGKHAGMLALALYLGAPAETYLDREHPVQRAIIEAISRFSDTRIEDIPVGVDGCAAPVFAISVRAMALMYARLVNPVSFDAATQRACARIVNAMSNNPALIGGTKDRLDTEMMRATKGALISKVGAEGVYTVGVLPCPRWPDGLGLALKIEDGDDHRARPTAVIEALRQLDVLTDDAISLVAMYSRFTIRNRRGDIVGEVRPAFNLKFAS